MNYDELCKDIMKISPSIRFVMILNRNGEQAAGGYRENVKSMLNDEEIKMTLFHAGQRWRTRETLAHRIGNAKYSITEYEKVKRITIPIDKKHLLMISTETSADHTKIIDDILHLKEISSQ